MSRSRVSLRVAAGFATLMITGSVMASRRALAQNRNPDGPTVTIGAPLPLPVQDVDVSSPARHAFQKQASFTVSAGTSEVCDTIATVPSGQRLVVEYAGATVGSLPVGQSVRHVQLRTRVGDDVVFHNLVQALTNAASEFMVGQQVRIYADPTLPVDMCVARLGGVAGSFIVFGTVSGFLVDLPEATVQRR